MLEAFNYYKGEFLIMLGINNKNNKKKERLLRDEVKSNNQILNLTLDSYVQTQKRGFENVNKKFLTSFDCSVNTSIDDVIAEQDEEFKEVVS